jgi:hypothetical protein
MVRWWFAILGTIVAVWLGFVLVGWITQPVRTASEVREKVGNADNVINTYEGFHDLCASVRAIDKKIADKQDEIAAYDRRHPDGDPSDRYQAAPKRDRLDTELAGLKSQRADLAEDYNADSAKANKSLFKDGRLPERLDDTTPTCN